MRILIVEDEPRMRELLCRGLYEHGHTVMTAGDGDAATELALDHRFDVIVLDVGLPKMNGYQVAQVLRNKKNKASILMLTAFDQEDDVIRGLDIGADDYLTKPFSFTELLARIRCITRSNSDPLPTSMHVDGLIVDLVQHTVYREGRQIYVTRTEFVLLQSLMEQSPHIVLRHELIKSIWGEKRDVNRGKLDTLMNSLRNKVDSPFGGSLIHTVRGIGYYAGKKVIEDTCQVGPSA